MSLWGKIKKKAKKAWKKVKNTVKKVFRIIKEVIQRTIGILDLIGSLIGIRPRKYLRLKIYILRSNGTPVQKPAYVQAWLDKTIEIFDKKLNVEVRKPNLYLEFIDVLNEDAPDYALNPPAFSVGAGFSDAADYFEDKCSYPRTSTGGAFADFLGYGEPIYAFVVNQVQGSDKGAVYWFAQNYCILSNNAPLTTLAHELGHNCGCRDSSSVGNLMNHDPDKRKDCHLTRWQISWMRNSRFIVFVPRRG